MARVFLAKRVVHVSLSAFGIHSVIVWLDVRTLTARNSDIDLLYLQQKRGGGLKAMDSDSD